MLESEKKMSETNSKWKKQKRSDDSGTHCKTKLTFGTGSNQMTIFESLSKLFHNN